MRFTLGALKRLISEAVVKLHQFPTKFEFEFTDELTENPDIYETVIVARSEVEARKIFKREYGDFYILKVTDTDESPWVE